MKNRQHGNHEGGSTWSWWLGQKVNGATGMQTRQELGAAGTMDPGGDRGSGAPQQIEQRQRAAGGRREEVGDGDWARWRRAHEEGAAGTGRGQQEANGGGSRCAEGVEERGGRAREEQQGGAMAGDGRARGRAPTELLAGGGRKQRRGRGGARAQEAERGETEEIEGSGHGKANESGTTREKSNSSRGCRRRRQGSWTWQRGAPSSKGNGRTAADPGMEVVGLSFPAGSKWRQASGLGSPGGSARRCCKEVSGAMAVREETASSRLVGWSSKQRREGLGTGQRWTRSSGGTRLGGSLATEMMMARHVGGGPGVEDDGSVHSHGGADAEPELLVSEASWTPWRTSAREKEREPDVRER